MISFLRAHWFFVAIGVVLAAAAGLQGQTRWMQDFHVLTAGIFLAFLVTGLVAGLLASLACGVIGPYVITRRIVFLSGAIAHMAVGGIGAAFDFHAGTLRQAPAWMQARGLEWLFRLVQLRSPVLQ